MTVFRLLTLLMLLPVWPGSARAEEAKTRLASHVIVYDVSGSMNRPTDSGLLRYELAHDFIHQVVDRLHRDEPSVPIGLVLLGNKVDWRRKSPKQNCEDFEVAVPVRAAGRGTNTLEEIKAATDNLTAVGETPLVEAMILAASRMPDEGGGLTVVTDLQRNAEKTGYDTVCPADPCDRDPRFNFRERLKHLGRSPGFEDKVKVEFIVASGLRKGIDDQAVEDIRRCTGAEVLRINGPDDALNAGGKVANALGAPGPGSDSGGWAPEQKPRRESTDHPAEGQGSADEGPVTVVLDWQPAIDIGGWHFAEIGTEGIYSCQVARKAPFDGDQVTLRVKPCHQVTLRLRDRENLGNWPYKDIDGDGGAPVRWTLEPSILRLRTDAPPGQEVVWSVTTGAHTVSPPPDRPDLRVPPGRYSIRLTMRDRASGQVGTAEKAVEVQYKADVPVVFAQQDLLAMRAAPVPRTPAPAPGSVPAPPPRDGRLQIQAFPGANVPGTGLAVSVRNANGSVVLQGSRLPVSQELPAGRYDIAVSVNGARLTAPTVTIAPDAEATVLLTPPRGRLVLTVDRDATSQAAEQTLTWRVEPASGTGAPIGQNGGARFDRVLPPGRYKVEVWDGGGMGRAVVEIAPGRLAREAVALRRQ